MVEIPSLDVNPKKKNVTMKAVTYQKSLPTDHPESQVDITLDRPAPGPRDLLVEVRAISVNPVDTKVRAGGGPGAGDKVLGWDAAGIVAEVGADVTLFAPGARR
jgi:NADPH2:quinone reductase